MKLSHSIFTLAIAVASAQLSVQAQQLPNPGFESQWSDYTPWTGSNNTAIEGKTSAPWKVSNFVTSGGNATGTVATQVAGCNSDNAMQLSNKYSSLLIKTFPGYASLGTPWNTSITKAGSTSAVDCGTMGGIAFTHHPDAIAFDYKHAGSSTASVVAYSWKGKTSQANVPTENKYTILAWQNPKPATAIIENRDLNILGLSTPQGGTVTKSADFELVCKLEGKITTQADDWATATFPFEYLSNSRPEMFNVIFASCDYLGSRTSPSGDNFTIDNVRLIYHSRLSAIKVNGVDIPDHDSDTYEYVLDTPYSPDHDITVTHMGKTASHTITFDDTNCTATIHVTNVDADIDDATSHTYTLQFAQPAAPAVTYEGFIKIFLGSDAPMQLDDQTVKITSTGDNTCTFELDNFTLSGDPSESLGDIVINDVTITDTTIGGKPWIKYTGSANELKLADGEIIADVTLEAYENDSHDLIAYIHVMWHMDETTVVPLEVEFRTNDFDTVTGIDTVNNDATNATQRYFTAGGIEVSTPTAPGLYIVLRGNETTKLLVK